MVNYHPLIGSQCNSDQKLFNLFDQHFLPYEILLYSFFSKDRLMWNRFIWLYSKLIHIVRPTFRISVSIQWCATNCCCRPRYCWPMKTVSLVYWRIVPSPPPPPMRLRKTLFPMFQILLSFLRSVAKNNYILRQMKKIPWISWALKCHAPN